MSVKCQFEMKVKSYWRATITTRCIHSLFVKIQRAVCDAVIKKIISTVSRLYRRICFVGTLSLYVLMVFTCVGFACVISWAIYLDEVMKQYVFKGSIKGHSKCCVFLDKWQWGSSFTTTKNKVNLVSYTQTQVHICKVVTRHFVVAARHTLQSRYYTKVDT